MPIDISVKFIGNRPFPCIKFFRYTDSMPYALFIDRVRAHAGILAKFISACCNHFLTREWHLPLLAEGTFSELAGYTSLISLIFL